MKSGTPRTGTRRLYAEFAAHEADAAAVAAAAARLQAIGYQAADLERVPDAAVACLGCGNPLALAGLRPGETVLDLGCGGGLDVFLAADRVGPRGHVVGVDATPEMVAKARRNAATGGFRNTTFVQGTIEHLPLQDGTFDVALSNCVMNHGADKTAAFREAFRVLKPGGRLCVTDLVTAGEFSAEALSDPVWGEWLRGAANRADYLAAIAKAGFRDVVVVRESAFPSSEQDERLRGRIISLAVTATR